MPYREFVRSGESGKSKKPRQCAHCGEMGRGLIGAPRGGWIHPECLKKLHRKTVLGDGFSTRL